MGCPSREKKFIEESENTAIFNFYKDLISKYEVIGSIIYHSCGGLVYYLGEMEEENYWSKTYGSREIEYNKKVAETYSKESNYKLETPKTYTTFCAKLRTILPGSLVVELGHLRSTPLSGFINFDIKDLDSEEDMRRELKRFNRHFDQTYENNERALIKTLEVMEKEYAKYFKKF